MPGGAYAESLQVQLFYRLNYLFKCSALSLRLRTGCLACNAIRWFLCFGALSIWNFKCLPVQARWSVESVHTKNIVSILHLLVALARHFRCQPWWWWRRCWRRCHWLWWWLSRFTSFQGSNSTARERCSWRCDRDKTRGGELNTSLTLQLLHVCLGQVLTHRVIVEELTSFYDDVGMRCERDAFDTLFDHAPDKLQVNNNIIYRSHILINRRWWRRAWWLLWTSIWTKSIWRWLSWSPSSRMGWDQW